MGIKLWKLSLSNVYGLKMIKYRFKMLNKWWISPVKTWHLSTAVRDSLSGTKSNWADQVYLQFLFAPNYIQKPADFNPSCLSLRALVKLGQTLSSSRGFLIFSAHFSNNELKRISGLQHFSQCWCEELKWSFSVGSTRWTLCGSDSEAPHGVKHINHQAPHHQSCSPHPSLKTRPSPRKTADQSTNSWSMWTWSPAQPRTPRVQKASIRRRGFSSQDTFHAQSQSGGLLTCF